MTLNRVYVEQVTISSQRLTEREPDTSASLVNLTWMSVDCGRSWSNWRTPPQAQWEPGRSKHKDPSRGACLNPYDLQFLSTIYNLCCQNFSIGLSLLKFFFSPLLSGCSFTNVTTFEQLVTECHHFSGNQQQQLFNILPERESFSPVIHYYLVCFLSFMLFMFYAV